MCTAAHDSSKGWCVIGTGGVDQFRRHHSPGCSVRRREGSSEVHDTAVQHHAKSNRAGPGRPTMPPRSSKGIGKFEFIRHPRMDDNSGAEPTARHRHKSNAQQGQPRSHTTPPTPPPSPPPTHCPPSQFTHHISRRQLKQLVYALRLDVCFCIHHESRRTGHFHT